MQNIEDRSELGEPKTKKQLMLQKRLKAKQKNQPLEAKPFTKENLRKERNRFAAQKSRDRKKNYLENLQTQNQRLKSIISRCQICSQEIQDKNSTQEPIEQLNLPTTQTSPTFLNQTFIREQIHSEDSASNFTRYFWFGCLVVFLCFMNYQNSVMNGRQLLQNPSSQSPLLSGYIKNPPLQQPVKSKAIIYQAAKSSNLTLKSHPKYKSCEECFKCFRNTTNQTKNDLSTLPNQQKQAVNSTNSSKILFCKSRAKFFLEIYEALHGKESKNSRQITKMLIKGKALNDLLQQDCFYGEEISEDEQYLISFTVAILEMTPVKMSRSSRLLAHSD